MLWSHPMDRRADRIVLLWDTISPRLGSMDLTLPYTFYPIALPHWIGWTLFLLAMLGGAAVGIARGQGRGWLSGALAGVLAAIGFLAATMIASMIITFFVHDQ
ncbi:MAG TPA: hypothetical protein VIT87_00165 [Gemmatimonadales bacterium]